MAPDVDPLFRGGKAADYDSRIRRTVPGYEVLHELTTAELIVRVPEEAHVLVVGAGTGAEILPLARRRPRWTFTATDLSADMLDVAGARLGEAGLADRVTTHVGPLDTLPEGPVHDAALLVLVAHFVPDDGARQRLYDDIAARLRPGGLLLTAELVDTGDELADELYRTSRVVHGLDPQDADAAVERVRRDFHPLTTDRTADLLGASGFGRSDTYFRALGFVAQAATLDSSEQHP